MTPSIPKDETGDTIIVWLDLETTGLDPNGGEILEFAAFATDIYGNSIGHPIQQVFQHKRDDVIASMDDYVLNMHLGSGLLTQVWSNDNRDAIQRRNAGKWRDIQSWFARLPGKPKLRNLGGNSIHFDRLWLQAKQSDLLENVSHRMLDVSSLLIVVPEARERGTETAHRALADAQQSHRTYTEKFLPLLRPQPRMV
tara:strand:- start:33957 stop:34547 length:591 start_codon:yes stop_codon:yes gene_type:complete